MSATLATIVRPEVTKRPRRIRSDFQRLLGRDRAPFRPSRRHCKASRARRPRAAGHRHRADRDRSGGPRLHHLFPTKGGCDDGPRHATLTVSTILVAFAGVFLICFMKGAFGGGFSIVGIPLLSIVMDPVTAGGLLAPLFIAMDLFALLLLEALDVVEAGPCAAPAGARDRHRASAICCSASSTIAPSRS